MELPGELPLGVDSKLVLELNHADLYFTGRVDHLPVMRARVTTVGESTSLEAVSSGGTLTIRRTDVGHDADLPRLRLDVALGPGRSVHIQGADLSVHAEHGLPEGSGHTAYRLDLEQSTADLSGVRVSEVKSVASTVSLTGTDGMLLVTLDDSLAQVNGHSGRLEATAGESNLVIADHAGEIVTHLEGGSLEIAGGEGTVQGTASGAHLAFDAWRGDVEIAARNSVLEVRGAEVRKRWTVEGSDLELDLERVWGTVTASLEGGSLRGTELNAAIQATAWSGTRVEFVGIHGSLNLDLSDGAEGWLSGVQGAIDAKVTDARLEADEIDQLTLNGSGAEVSIRRIAQLKTLEMVGSELDLDLRGVSGKPSLTLTGEGHAWVRLQAPCIVQLAGSEASLESSIEVTSCELRFPGQSVSPQQDRDRHGGVRPTYLTVTMSPAAVVEVEGEL